MRTILNIALLLFLFIDLNAQDQQEIKPWDLKIESWEDHNNDINNTCTFEFNEVKYITPKVLQSIKTNKIKLTIELTAIDGYKISYIHIVNSKKLKRPDIHDSRYISSAFCNQQGESGRAIFIRTLIEKEYSMIKFTKDE